MRMSLVTCILLIGITGSIYAFPFANYGNVRVPDAYVMPHLMGKVSANNYFYPENDLKSDTYAYNFAGAVNIGLFKFSEIGFVASGDDVYYAQVKARIIGETLSLPDISIGVDNLFSRIPSKSPSDPDIVDVANFRKNTAYLAISKTILLSGLPKIGDVPTRLTLGAGSHRFKSSGTLAGQFEGIFGAVQIEPARNFAIITEIDGHNLNTGLEYRYRNFASRLELYRIEEWNRRDPKIGLTFSYVFDQLVAPEERQGFSPIQTFDRQLLEVREGTSLDELQRIRRQREKAEEELEEIRRLLYYRE